MTDTAGHAVERATHSRFALAHPHWYLSLHAMAGVAVAALCTWAFAAMADEIPEQGAMVRVDLAVTSWLQTHGSERGEAIFSAVSLLGAQVLVASLAIVALALLVKRSWRHLATLAIMCGGGALLNTTLKLVFRRTRPSFAAEFHETTWSFPSGHAMNSLIIYGLFAWWLASRYPRHRRAIVIATAVLVGAIGFSRIYLGVHYLSDVMAGYAAGSVWLLACITGQRFAARRHIGSDTEQSSEH